jgi:hypothetical protein
MCNCCGVNENKFARFETGAIRDADIAGAKDGGFPARFDLISPIALKRLAETYGEGALKYDDHDWRKGFPFSVVVNHLFAHLVAYLKGDKTEDHMAHLTWNAFVIMHFEETMPELALRGGCLYDSCASFS